MRKNRTMNSRGNQQLTVALLTILFSLIAILIALLLNFSFDKEDKNTIGTDNQVSIADNVDEPAEKVDELTSNEKEVEKRFNKIKEKYNKFLPGIVCWGDSLTEGSLCETNYPEILGKTIQENITDKFDIYNYFDDKYYDVLEEKEYKLNTVEIVNLGVGGETSDTIVGRNGAIDMVNAYDIVIPAESIPVVLSIDSADGGYCQPIRMGDYGGVNPVTIEGVSGTLSIEQENAFDYECTYYFTRSEPGEEVSVPAGATIHTYAEDKYLDYWMVIFIGTNGGYEDIDDLIQQHKAMIKQQNSNNYIILGMHYGNPDSLNEIDSAMEKEFGKHYISLHKYFTENDLSEYGYTLTDYDRELQSQGYCPASIQYEGLHFNEKGYTVISDLIYKRMIELGYFDKVARLLNVELD